MKLCCVVRGTYEPGSGHSLTPCDGSVQHADGFFCNEVAAMTYEQ